jgi:primosomal protein N' (replication factor Y)
MYADIIIDISHESLDRTYQYGIPDDYMQNAVIGAPVVVPFGKGTRKINGYIVELSYSPKIEEELIKPIDRVVVNAPVIESHLIYLAYWMKETFGGTMNDSLKTVIPVRNAVKIKEQRSIQLAIGVEQANQLYIEFQKKNNRAKLRLLGALLHEKIIDYQTAVNDLKIPRSTLELLEKQGITKTNSEQIYRNPIKNQTAEYKKVTLNENQQLIVDDFNKEYRDGIRSTYLIHGITGSGKTEVYMEIISAVINSGRQVIVLIPEIALTYQTVLRFYRRFGERISIMNSRMSQGERYDQSQRAKNGEIDIIIGPRSALFTPFLKLGLIIIDEEHEYSYKSESVPKYHAVEVAIKRAQLTQSSVILGSATPSLESYLKAQKGEITLYTLKNRAKEAQQPFVWIIDLREELKKKNKSIFSAKLKELINDRLNRHEQIMLFLNRRGYAGFVSCRSCGYVVKCPHCEVSMTAHNNGTMVCHYCGYSIKQPSTCPECNSKYIAAFGTGTQKVEELVKKEFPEAKVLRMDADTTRNKGGHEAILSAFSQHRADILVGTQMIVKGHDFPSVTLVGIIAADLSLYTGDFRASERTFQLLCQAAGRAGRDVLPGEVVIQTYHPEHYSIINAAQGDYEAFFEQEMLYRRLMKYPPAAHILLLLVTSGKEEQAVKAAALLGEALKHYNEEHSITADIIGPAPASLSKLNDIYRQVLYIKHDEYSVLVETKNYLEGYFKYSQLFTGSNLQFDFDPVSSY